MIPVRGKGKRHLRLGGEDKVHKPGTEVGEGKEQEMTDHVPS